MAQGRTPRQKADELASFFDRCYEANHHSSSTLHDVLRLWWYTLERFTPKGEGLYMETVARMQPEAVRMAPEGFALLLTHFVVDEAYEDLLGPVYETLASRWGRKALGQYFTPWAVAVMMAEITVHDHDWEKVPRPTFNEPCIGSGSLPLAMKASVAKRFGRERVEAMLFTGQDLDPVCVLMASIQLRMTHDSIMSDWLMASAFELRSRTDPKIEAPDTPLDNPVMDG